MKKKVLVVDDEKSIADPIAYVLKREGYEVITASNGEDALKIIHESAPDIVILDIMMPGMSGYDVCRKLNEKDRPGIIMLTAKNDIVDKVLGLELGADDYITKPFDIRELAARVNALARRFNNNPAKEDDVIKIGGIKIIISQRKVVVNGRILDLTPKEYDLLLLLASHPERVYTRDELLNLVWGMEYEGGTRTVDIHIQRIRKKLGKRCQDVIQTVFGIGYKAVGDADEGKYKI